MHVARGRASGGTDPANHLSPGDLLADNDLDLRKVVVGGREAVVVPVGVADHDAIAVAAGPPRVHDRPVEGRPGGVSARLTEVDAVMPALPVGERVGTVTEAGGRGVVGDRPADEVAPGCHGRSGRDDAHRVGDEVPVLDQSCDEGGRPDRAAATLTSGALCGPPGSAATDCGRTI